LKTGTGTVTLTISRLGRSIFTTNQAVALAANGMATLTFTWPAPMTDYRGYMVEAWLNNGSFAVTAINVSSDWRRYPRYGYITEFYQGQSSQRNTNIVRQLTRDYHVNCVQFYDWMWRHENVIQRSRSSIVDPWTDWRGAHISYAVLRDMVAKAHDRNIAAMPYFQIYVGLDGYEQISGVSPQWGLFSDPLHANLPAEYRAFGQIHR
jgi:dextranase